MDAPSHSAASPGGRRRILVATSTFPPATDDGTPGFVRDLSRQLTRWFDVHVLLPRTRGQSATGRDGDLTLHPFAYFPRRWEDLADGAILENLHAERARWLQVPAFFAAETLALRRAVARLRPDLVHAHWLIPQGVAALAGVPREIPLVVTTLGGDLYALNDPISTRLKRAVCRRASAMTTQNVDMRERLLRLGADPLTTRHLPVGADLDGIRALSRGSAVEPGLIVFVGRLAQKKGVDVLLEAIGHLPAGVDHRVEILGDGPLRAHLEQLAAGRPVTFLGAQPRAEVARALGRAAIVVVPSVVAASGDQEGLPLVMLEAMGAARPVVASNLPGLADAIDDGRTGVLVPPGDARALANALDGLLTDPARAAVLGQNASRAADEYGAPAIAARFAELFEEALASKPRGRRA